MMELVSPWAMSSANAYSETIPGMIQTRSVVDGIDLGHAFSLPVSPASLPSGRGEAGSYPHPALEAGESRTSSFLPG
jgi:hypothetical protein